MKMRYVLAALLMTGTAAHAGNSISFEINGHRVRIEAPKNCSELSCIQISAPGVTAADFGFKNTKTSRDEDDNVVVRNDPPAPKYDPAPAPVAQVAAPALAPAASTPPAPATTLASTAPASAGNDIAPAAPAPSASASPAPAPVAAAPAPTTPLGVWATEENKGNVRVEQCGQNLCGYAVKTGERVLIDMKPSNAKWTGQIHDPDSGRDYDSTIVMKGPNSLKVQGCAFGGMFCGGQTWSRIS
jgi:uncharacterized protein (DUF2147 family)